MSWKRLDFGISTSEKFPALSHRGIVLWTFVLPWSDIFGVYPRSPRLMKAQCVPMFNFTDTEVANAVDELVAAKLYHVFDDESGKPFILYHDHADHNPPGVFSGKYSSFPTPPTGICRCVQKSISSVRFPTGRPPNVEKERPFNGHEMALVPSCIVSSSEEGGTGGDGGPEKGPEKPSPEGLVRAFRFCGMPGPRAKAEAIADLLRQGVDYGRIMAAATDPFNRSRDFYDILRTIRPKSKRVDALDQWARDGMKGRKEKSDEPR